MGIRRIGIVGAGSMGAAVAALAASAGVPVVLLDVPGDENRNEPARRGLKRALEASRPPAFMHPRRADLIEIGNTEDDLQRLADCDWVLEAIPEQVDLKRQLFERVEGVVRPDAIVTTNTSGIPMAVLAEGRSAGFRRRFFGTHFFNPPRYMHLLEVIPEPDTDPDVLHTLESFADRILGKGVVRAKDAPGFIANRIGLYGSIQIARLMEQLDLTIDEADTLTGPILGRPKSATFRTLDIAGLDVLRHATEALRRATGEDLELPAWMLKLVEEGKLGEKTGAGCYRRVGREIQTLDWRTGEYRPRVEPEIEGLAAVRNGPLADRLHAALAAPGKYGEFVRGVVARTIHYALEKAPELAYDLPSVDRAMQWGYGWEAGPVLQADLIGHDRLRELFAEQGLGEPALLTAADQRFYQETAGGTRALALGGGYEVVSESPDTVSAAALRRAGRVIKENASAALLDLGDGVALLEFRSKMGTMGAGVIDMIHEAREWLETADAAGLVVGHDDSRAFSAGANLVEVLEAVGRQEWDELDAFIARFQDALMGLRQAPRPVVAAPFGLTLGGGAELLLHSDRVRTHAELNVGLVETGVGLLPAGGGTKEMLFRFTEALEPFDEVDAFAAVKRAFELISTAKVCGSALEAFDMGFLRRGDAITMNRDRLIADAKRTVLYLAPDYVPPAPRRIRALGDRALGNLRYAIFAMREAGRISDHDVRVGQEVARVLCGGSGPPRIVTEQDILDLEREAFLSLLGTEKTQERIRYTLETGKPLRN